MARFYGTHRLLTGGVFWRPDIRLSQIPPVGSQGSLCETAQPRSQLVTQTNVPSLNQFTNLLLPRAFLPSTVSPTFGFAFVPRDFLQGLFRVYDMDLPTQLTKLPDLGEVSPELSAALSKVDPSTLSYYGEFLLAPLAFFVSNVCTAAQSGPDSGLVSVNDRGAWPVGDQGLVTVETAFIHLNTSFTPSGRFPAYSNQTSMDPNADPQHGTNFTKWFQIGHDAAVCVHKYEPWIIEGYNTSTGSSFVLKIVGKGSWSTSLSPSGNIRGARIADTRYLNATGKDVAFIAAHKKGVVRMGEAGLNQSSSIVPVAPTPVVGPVVPSCTRFLLTSIYSTDYFLHRRHWA